MYAKAPPRPSSGATVIVLSVAMAAVCAGILGFLAWLIIPSTRPASADEAEPCDDDNPCAEGYICERKQCLVFMAPPAPSCEENQAIDGCNCWAPLVPRTRDGQRMCVKADGAACESPEVQSALKKLVSSCKQRGGQGLSCKPADWQQLAMKDAEFDDIVANFPGTVTVHFPSGSPYIGDNFSRWPSSEVRAHYAQALLENKSKFDEARHIFVIGRASVGGATVETNRKFGNERMLFARALLKDLYASAPDTDKDALDRKVLNFTLGDTRQIDAAFFTERFLARAVTWDDVSKQDFERILRNATKAHPDEKRKAVSIMNQVAFIVPIPCEAAEGE